MDLLGYYKHAVRSATSLTNMQLVLKKEPFLQLVHGDPVMRKLVHIELGPRNGAKTSRFANFGGNISVCSGACKAARSAHPGRLLHPAMPISLAAPAKEIFLDGEAADAWVSATAEWANTSRELSVDWARPPAAACPRT